jgi:hypothetical protein
MSHELFSRNPDLKRLRDEGYFVQQQGGYLVMREVPYVDARREVRTGTLISSLTLAGDPADRLSAKVRRRGGQLPFWWAFSLRAFLLLRCRQARRAL